MATTQHTPGPWRVAGDEIWADGQRVRRLATGRGAYDEKDRAARDANARLIAAAPDLLHLLTEILERDLLLECNPQDSDLWGLPECPPDHPNCCYSCDMRHRIRAAIAKAGGQA